MRTDYKDFPKQYIGESDIATLVMVGYRVGEGLATEKLEFGEDNDYYAYIIDKPNIKVGSHYTKMATFNAWLKIYDDNRLVKTLEGDVINVYRAGEMGCIIEVLPEELLVGEQLCIKTE